MRANERDANPAFAALYSISVCAQASPVKADASRAEKTKGHAIPGMLPCGIARDGRGDNKQQVTLAPGGGQRLLLGCVIAVVGDCAKFALLQLHLAGGIFQDFADDGKGGCPQTKEDA